MSRNERAEAGKGGAIGDRKAEILVCERLVLDIGERIARIGNAVLPLTSKEYGILETLMCGQGKVCSKTDIFSRVWDTAYIDDKATVHVHISHLRKKLSAYDADHIYIETEWGRGYRMYATLLDEDAESPEGRQGE